MKHLLSGAAVLFLAGLPVGSVAQVVPAQAIQRVTLHRPDGTTVTNATVVWRNGVIEAAGASVAIPFDARVINGGDSLHVYPGFIDGLADWGTPDIPRQQERPERPAEPGYERAGIQPDRSVQPLIKRDAPEFTQARNAGFTLMAIAPKGAMLPGQVSVFHVRGDQTVSSIVRTNIAPKASFIAARGAYPSTIMGVMARYRQLVYDARALQAFQASGAANAGRDAVLESLFPVIDKTQPLFFVADDREAIRRLFSLSDELGFNAVLVSGKEAHTFASELYRRKMPVLVSLDFAASPDTAKGKTAEEDAWKARQREAWAAHVRNVRTLLDAGVQVGFASNGLKPADLKKNFEILLTDGGLTEIELLRILTVNTASILGMGTRTGSLGIGQMADLVVTTNPLSDKSMRVVYTVAAGELTEIKATPSAPTGRGRMSE